MRKTTLALLATTVAAIFSAPVAQAETLVIWHDLGDNGIRWFEELNERYRTIDPNVTITTVSYPTDQWFGNVIAAINTDSAPDLIYNNYERVIRIQNQTGRVMDLSDQLPADTDFLSEADLRVATYEDRMIIFPIQRVQMGFGARASWLEALGEKMPTTWAETLRIAQRFVTDDPDGNGADDTFGIASEAANPRDLIHMLDLYTSVPGCGTRWSTRTGRWSSPRIAIARC